MTILKGTMQDGTVLPVQVDAQGRLVAEGLQGAAGPQGPEGPAGPAGPPGDPGLPGGANDGDVLWWQSGQAVWAPAPSGMTFETSVVTQSTTAAIGTPPGWTPNMPNAYDADQDNYHRVTATGSTSQIVVTTADQQLKGKVEAVFWGNNVALFEATASWTSASGRNDGSISAARMTLVRQLLMDDPDDYITSFTVRYGAEPGYNSEVRFHGFWVNDQWFVGRSTRTATVADTHDLRYFAAGDYVQTSDGRTYLIKGMAGTQLTVLGEGDQTLNGQTFKRPYA